MMATYYVINDYLVVADTLDDLQCQFLFACALCCGSAFSSQEDLQIHMATHDKPTSSLPVDVTSSHLLSDENQIAIASDPQYVQQHCGGCCS